MPNDRGPMPKDGLIVVVKRDRPTREPTVPMLAELRRLGQVWMAVSRTWSGRPT